MDYHFCPKCGESLENVFIAEEGHDRLRCTGCKFIFYQNSKPTAAALIIDNRGQVLLEDRAKDPRGWDVPGGFLELGERPEDGVRREVREETGLEIGNLSFMGIFMEPGGFYGPSLNICYAAKVVGGTERPNAEVAQLHWFRPQELPDNMAFQNGKDMLNAWLVQLGYPKKYPELSLIK